jgi:hypothetical protein
MKNFKGGIQKGVENAGIIEYIFGVLAFISILPVLSVYFILVKLTIQPLVWLKKKVWK